MVQDPKCEDAPTKETEAPIDIDKEIKENMGAGKKHLLCSDYPEAVACFQEACTFLSNKHGQMAQECGDAYYYYGVSLLELARLENGVLGNALKGVPEEDEEESDKDEEQFEKADLPEGEREKLREEVEAAMATEDEDAADEGEESEKKEEKDSSTEKEKEICEQTKTDESKKTEGEIKEPKEEKKEEKTEEKVSEPAKVEKSEPSSSKCEQSKEGEEIEEDPDDISNMQLAWEMIELAKVLYKKREKGNDTSLMIAQCHLKLGELGLEVENYPQAIGDFLECLVMQKEHLPETDRKLAETHYNLGLAYSFEKRYDNALEHYQNALNVLEARVDLLEEMIENQEGQKEKESETIAECKEVGEIKELIPDINSKIEDVLLVKKQNERRLEGSPFRQSAGETSTGFGAGTSTSQDKPCSSIPVRKVAPTSSCTSSKESTSDISHLVRRKRPSPDEEESAPEAEGESKKAKQENGAGDKENGSGNGHSANGSNGHSAEKSNEKNGHSKTPEKAAETEDAASALKKKMAAAGDAPVAMET